MAAVPVTVESPTVAAGPYVNWNVRITMQIAITASETLSSVKAGTLRTYRAPEPGRDAPRLDRHFELRHPPVVRILAPVRQ